MPSHSPSSYSVSRASLCGPAPPYRERGRRIVAGSPVHVHDAHRDDLGRDGGAAGVATGARGVSRSAAAWCRCLPHGGRSGTCRTWRSWPGSWRAAPGLVGLAPMVPRAGPLSLGPGSRGPLVVVGPGAEEAGRVEAWRMTRVTRHVGRRRSQPPLQDRCSSGTCRSRSRAPRRYSTCDNPDSPSGDPAVVRSRVRTTARVARRAALVAGGDGRDHDRVGRGVARRARRGRVDVDEVGAGVAAGRPGRPRRVSP